MFAMQDSLSNNRSRSRIALVPWLAGAIAAGLVLGTAGIARADQPEPPAEGEKAAEGKAAEAKTPETPAESKPAPAAEAPSPKNYVTAVLGTTLAYKPNGGDFGGPLKDIDPAVGYGRLITPTIALELDVGLVFIKTDYSNFLLVPGVVWNFSTHFYAAMRFLVYVDPEVNLALFPGIGAFYGFSNGIGLSLEFNPSSVVGRGKPDFSLPLTAGVLYSF